MLSVQEAAEIIVTAMTDFGRSEALIKRYQSFFTSFHIFASSHDMNDDPDAAYVLWKQENFPDASEHKQKMDSLAAKALLYTMKIGHIPYDFFKTLPIKDRLVPILFEVLCGFLDYAGNMCSEIHLSNVKTRCSIFLFWAQVNGIRSISELNYDFLQLFYDEHNYTINPSRGMILSNVEAFLLYLAEKQMIPYAYALFLNSNRHASLLKISAMSSTDQKIISSLRDLSLQDFPADEFYISSVDFFEVLRKHKYEETVCNIWKMTSESLYLFLHRNNLGYRREIVDIWYSYYRQIISSSNQMMSRRILKQYEQFTENGDIDPLTVFSYTPSPLDRISTWCKPAVDSFLARKQREQKAASTVVMYRSSILRFCNWLIQNDVNSYDEITYDHIKRFDNEDPHTTLEGKAAYNSRIRRFLMYLEEIGLITNRLFMSIPTAYAKRERLVTVLTREEITTIDEYVNSATTELQLRDAAMIQLGLRMGLRSIDICNLKFDEIDWKARTIRFIQQKTKVEVLLPMPVSVGNAIYKYIQGRSKQIQFPYVFAPLGRRGYSLTRYACKAALDRALPDFHRGFHCLRKTFSSGLLTRGVKPSVIDDALGHTSNCDQDRYLALDDERMKMCPLCLTNEGIPSLRRKSV